MKRPVVGSSNTRNAFFLPVKDIAGLMKPKSSLTINGIEHETEIRIESYICQLCACAGAV